jgi:predicted CoA-binding protein
MEQKTTVVLGASVNPERYANRAIVSLRKKNHPVYAVGLKPGIVGDVNILAGTPPFDAVDTVTIYLSKKNQKNLYDYILSLKPKRIIFNPGAENEELSEIASANNIETLEACTLVLLSTHQY